jgi:tetratricopeptide (TPR) repeat protein
VTLIARLSGFSRGRDFSRLQPMAGSAGIQMKNATKLLLVMLALSGATVLVQFLMPAESGKETVHDPQQSAGTSPASRSRADREGSRNTALPGYPPEMSTQAESAEILFRDCVSTRFPSAADAPTRAVACSKALQTRQLALDQIAQARLARGVARTLLGDRELASEDYLDTIQRYDQLMDPRNPDALKLYRRAVALDAVGRTDEALKDYGAAIAADPKSALAFLERGVLLAVRKRAYDRAIEDFDKVLVLQPDNVIALIARGDALSNLGDSAHAIRDLNRAVALEPSNAMAHLTRGLVEARLGNRGRAREDYETTLRLAPSNVDARVNLAALDSLEGRYTAAIVNLDAAITIDSQSVRAFYNRGYAHFALGQHDKAIADYDSAIRIDPRFGIAYNNRALVRAIVGRDLVKALADSEEALKLLPLNLDVRETRGFIFLRLGDPALALHEYNAVLDGDPNQPVALYGRGLARIRLGDKAGGAQDQAAAQTLLPEVGQKFAVYGP